MRNLIGKFFFRFGYVLMSFKLLRIFVLLNFDKIIELGYYILKVYIYKNVSK